MSMDESDPEGQAHLAGFTKALSELGWTRGRSLQMEVRWGGADINRIRTFAKELAALQPDLIVSQGTPVTAALTPLLARQDNRCRFRDAAHASLNHDSPFRNSGYVRGPAAGLGARAAVLTGPGCWPGCRIGQPEIVLNFQARPSSQHRRKRALTLPRGLDARSNTRHDGRGDDPGDVVRITHAPTHVAIADG